jgi:hypothetical protein
MLKTIDFRHTCVLATFIRKYIYIRLKVTTEINRGIQPFLLAVSTKI